jgi:chaperonin GroES
MAHIKPLEDRVVLKVEKEAEKTSAGGLIIQTMQEEKPQEAVVVAVGPGITFGNGEKLVPDVSVGDKVLFSKYQGTEITVDGEDYLILAYRDVLAVIG